MIDGIALINRKGVSSNSYNGMQWWPISSARFYKLQFNEHIVQINQTLYIYMTKENDRDNVVWVSADFFILNSENKEIRHIIIEGQP